MSFSSSPVNRAVAVYTLQGLAERLETHLFRLLLVSPGLAWPPLSAGRDTVDGTEYGVLRIIIVVVYW